MSKNRKELQELYNIEAEALDLDVQVFSDGPMNSEVALVGEGPGESEMRHGIPFAGGSGRFLWEQGRKYDITRNSVYVTNVVKRQISLSSKGNARHAVRRDELQRWITLLRWELEQLPNLKYIFVMGNYALEALTNQTGITSWRGSVLDAEIGERKVKLVLTYNPAYILREPKLEPIFIMDMYKLHRVMTGRWKPHEIETIIRPTYKEASEFIRKLRGDALPIALDIETSSREVACIGLANSPNLAMCINLRDEKENHFSQEEETKLWRLFQESLSQTRLVMHNGIFDSSYMWQKALLKLDCWHDTMLSHHLLFPQLPHSLAFLVAQYTTHPFYKDEGKNWREGSDIDTWWRYNCKDAALTVAVFNSLNKDLEKHKLDQFFYSHIMRLQPHLIQACVNGIGCDEELKEKLKEDIREDVAKVKAEFNQLVLEATGDEDYIINPNSPAQLGDLLFRKLRLRGRGTSTDETNRKRILADPGTGPLEKELLTILEKYKKEAKFLSTYVESEIDYDSYPPDYAIKPRFRCTYKQHGVSRAPGRLSSSKTIDGTGMNLQNQPKRAYEMFTADPGCVLIYLDGAQAEARIVGWYYDIKQWKEDFERARLEGDYDAHRALAAQMFKIPYEQTPTEDYNKDGSKSKRYIAKRCRHGLNYRMQPWKLADVTELPFHEARRAYQLYHSITPELQRGWQRVEENVRKSRELYNAYGRRWKVIQRLDDNVLESIIAFYPQSTMGDHVCRAWYLAEEDDEWPTGKARIALNNHDALIGIAEPEVALTALAIMKKHMEAPITITNLWNTKTEKLIIPTETKISKPDEKGVHRWSGLVDVEV